METGNVTMAETASRELKDICQKAMEARRDQRAGGTEVEISPN